MAVWGWNGLAQCNVPAPPAGLTYIEVAGGGTHSLARISDGTIVTWGSDWAGLDEIPDLPPGLTCIDVAAGDAHSLALGSDGRIEAWGDNYFGQCNVPSLPPGIRDVEVAAGGKWNGDHSLARRSDGSVVAWGLNDKDQCDVPALPSGTTCGALAGGGAHSLAIYGTGSLAASATFRTAGTNPASYAAFTTPILGGTYTALVDVGGTSGHNLAWLVGFTTPLSLTLSGGQTLLVNPGDPNGELLGLDLVSGPQATYDLPVPADAVFAGFALSTQALHWGGVTPFALSNAQDLILGYR
ncbi:MAG: hypothetical protein AB1726_11035 [Planctomycetota bacterium]